MSKSLPVLQCFPWLGKYQRLWRKRDVSAARVLWVWGFFLLAWLVGEPPIGTSQVWQVRIHPVGPWYVGDVLSWEVRPPPGQGEDFQGKMVTLQVDPPSGPRWRERLGLWGIDRVPAAVFPWVWDTWGVASGLHSLVVRFEGREVYRGRVYLYPESLRPTWEKEIQWAERVTSCCRIFYFTHTETARDLERLVDTVEKAYQRVQMQFGVRLEASAEVVFLPRLLGQGGFMGSEMWVTYRDRGPLMEPVSQIVYHEMVHWAERQILEHGRPSVFVEGLAVYLSGGHYRPGEPLFRRAQAVRMWGRYLPLATLSENFYQHQHELAYIQAGALVAYMVDRWGWETFWDFYSSLERPNEGESVVQALDRQLRRRFGLGLEELDADLRAFLDKHPPTPKDLEDVRQTVALYEGLRFYQKVMDPDAYYGTAWLPYRAIMQPRGIVTDAIRGPNTALHQTVELLLQQASLSWLHGDYVLAGRYVDEATRLVEAYDQGEVPWEALPWARQIRLWVAWTQACGGEIQRLDLGVNPPQAWIRTAESQPELLVWSLPEMPVSSLICPSQGGGPSLSKASDLP